MWAALLACTAPEGGRGALVVQDLGPAGPPGRRLGVALAAPATASAECTSSEEPDERHRFTSRAAAPHHQLEAIGLLADTEYTCVVEAGGRRGELTFRTDPLPAFDPWTVTGETTGYTLFNTGNACAIDAEPDYVVIVDPQGRVRWYLDLGPDLVCDIDAQFAATDPPRVHAGGGWAYFNMNQPNRGVFVDVSLGGEILLEREAPDFGYAWNHHSERLEDGTYVSLTSPVEEIGGNDWIGAGVELWSPDEGLVWSWQSLDLVQAGVIAEPESRAPFTANAVSLVEDGWGPAAWVSIYSRKELWRIDRETGERTHVIEPDGEFTVLDPDGDELSQEELPHCQHDPEWVDGPTGPDQRVLLYDNGNGKDPPHSRVAEYDIDLDARTATLLWSWTEPGWYNPTLGDADRLPDGNVLIAKGFNIGKTPNAQDTSEIVELTPPDAPVWRLTMIERHTRLYRAERIGPCEAFGNLAMCPELEP